MVDFETFAKSDYRAVKIKDCVAVPKSKKLLQFTLDSCGMLISAVHEEGGHEGLNLLMVDNRIPAGAKLY